MVIFVKLSGATVVENDLISLGSHVGKIAIVSPNRVGAYVELLITPPSSEQIQPIYAAPMPSIDADDLGVYICDPASRIATASGRVRYQVRFTYSGGLVETTPEGTFTIQPGVVVIPPDDPPANIYEEIRAAILASSALYSEVIHNLDKVMAAAELVEGNLADITAARHETVGAAEEARESAEKAENSAERSENIASELAAGRYIEKDPTVPEWAKQPDPPIKPTDEIIDSTAVSVKDVPADAATYAEVVEIGGMTYKDGDTLRSAAVTAVESVGVNLTDVLSDTKSVNGYYSDTPLNVVLEAGKRYVVSYDISCSADGFLTSVGIGDTAYRADLIQVSHENHKRAVFTLSVTESQIRQYGDRLFIRPARFLTSTQFTYTVSNICVKSGANADGIYTPYMSDAVHIPESVRSLDGYGWGINETLYNYIDLDKKQFVKRVGCVDMGVLTWEYNNGCFLARATVNEIFLEAKTPASTADTIPVRCGAYESKPWYLVQNKSADKTVAVYGSIYGGSLVYDAAYTDAASFKAAMSGVMLCYELAEPVITDISDLLADIVIRVEGGGKVRMVTEYGYDIPNTVRFYTSDNETIASESFVGDLHGTAARAKMAETDALGRVIHESYAPAGYGLGEKTNKRADYANIDNIKTIGWYHGSGIDGNPDANITINGVSFTYWYMRVEAWDSNNLYQKLYPTINTHPVLVRYCYAGVWQPWECENPPMATGVEYRTTERWQGKPVYTMLIDLGETPVGTPEQKTDKEVILIVNGITRVIGYDLYLNSGNENHPGLIYTFKGSDKTEFFEYWSYAWPDQHRLKIGLGSHTADVYTAYAIVKYLK